MTTTVSHFVRPAALAGTVWMLMAPFSFAHQDPVGDVHPSVRVENGLFAVYFSNNMIGDSNDRSFFRAVYSSDGQLVAPRHPVDPEAMPGRESDTTMS